MTRMRRCIRNAQETHCGSDCLWHVSILKCWNSVLGFCLAHGMVVAIVVGFVLGLEQCVCAVAFFEFVRCVCGLGFLFSFFSSWYSILFLFLVSWNMFVVWFELHLLFRLLFLTEFGEVFLFLFFQFYIFAGWTSFSVKMVLIKFCFCVSLHKAQSTNLNSYFTDKISSRFLIFCLFFF